MKQRPFCVRFNQEKSTNEDSFERVNITLVGVNELS